MRRLPTAFPFSYLSRAHRFPLRGPAGAPARIAIYANETNVHATLPALSEPTVILGRSNDPADHRGAGAPASLASAPSAAADAANASA